MRKLKRKISHLEGEIERGPEDILKMARLQRIKGEFSSLTRELLEACLSVLLNRKRFIELNEKDPRRREEVKGIEEEMGGMGEEMCWIRIEKRCGEYLNSYYEGLLQEGGQL